MACLLEVALVEVVQNGSLAEQEQECGTVQHMVTRGSVYHMVQAGYEFFTDREVITIFSAPNYCNTCDNDGAFLHIDHNLICSLQILKPEPRSPPMRTRALRSAPDAEIPRRRNKRNW
ncbi:hypothetical protein PR048_017336 [Dryococelus australis]|uniref:protein-serine/threonine phosphatase n=1 Tax=Dryococelus australis TaxID=614101 RepID=A0ABQ9H988_9NEOP|nr:hypothetical protein PR048_017336 [Dryococelus australis]